MRLVGPASACSRLPPPRVPPCLSGFLNPRVFPPLRLLSSSLPAHLPLLGGSRPPGSRGWMGVPGVEGRVVHPPGTGWSPTGARATPPPEPPRSSQPREVPPWGFPFIPSGPPGLSLLASSFSREVLGLGALPHYHSSSWPSAYSPSPTSLFTRFRFTFFFRLTR